MQKDDTVRVVIPQMANYELIGQVALEAVRDSWWGENSLHPDLVNPVLEEMKKKLANLHLEKDSLKISLQELDNFRYEIKAGKVIFAYDLKFYVTDGPGRVDRYNNFVRPFIKQELKKLQTKKGKIKVRVTDVIFQEEIKTGDNWPRERF